MKLCIFSAVSKIPTKSQVTPTLFALHFSTNLIKLPSSARRLCKYLTAFSFGQADPGWVDTPLWQIALWNNPFDNGDSVWKFTLIAPVVEIEYRVYEFQLEISLTAWQHYGTITSWLSKMKSLCFFFLQATYPHFPQRWWHYLDHPQIYGCACWPISALPPDPKAPRCQSLLRPQCTGNLQKKTNEIVPYTCFSGLARNLGKSGNKSRITIHFLLHFWQNNITRPFLKNDKL